ncbi:hypothetical protein [Lacticaseibacillus absianus]|uniref:hypothetical protein n=1 Tax=Lacticaseibacillus absianus TaxID=2729623 RepID=UPI0015CBCD4F|nr:hypothetical protein [Lacticaseibacillus absianus]
MGFFNRGRKATAPEESTDTPIIEAPIAQADPQERRIGPARSLEELVTDLAQAATAYNRARQGLQSHLIDQVDIQRKERMTLAEEWTAAKTEQEAVLAQLEELETQTDESLATTQADLGERQAALMATRRQQEAQLDAVTAQITGVAKTAAAEAAARDEIQAQVDAQLAAIREETDPLKLVAHAAAAQSSLEKFGRQLQQIEKRYDRAVAERTALEHDQTVAEQALAESTTRLAELDQALQQAAADMNARQVQRKVQREKLMAENTRLTAKQKQLSRLLDQVHGTIDTGERQLKDWFGTSHHVSGLQVAAGPTYVIVIDSFLPDDSDLMAAIVGRILEAGAASVGLYSEYFDINLADEVALWITEHHLPMNRIKIYNPLHMLQSQGQPAGAAIQLPTNLTTTGWTDDHLTQTLALKDSARVLRVTYREANAKSIRDIAYLEDGLLTKRSFFNTEGRLSANALFDETGELAQEVFYRQDGLTAYTVQYAEGAVWRLDLFDDHGILTDSFASVAAMTDWWRAQQFNDGFAFVGQLDDAKYREFVQAHELTAVPVVTAKAGAQIADLNWQMTTEVARFFVSTQQVAQALIQATPVDLEILELNQTYLPGNIEAPLLPAGEAK